MKKNAKQTEAEEYKTVRRNTLSVICTHLHVYTQTLFIVVPTTN